MRPLFVCILGVALVVALAGCIGPSAQTGQTSSSAQPSAGALQPTAENATAAPETVPTDEQKPITTPPSSGQAGLHTPAVGSPERKTILDALRVPVQRKLKQAVIFKISHFSVADEWAFVSGQPLQPNGNRIDYRKTPYAQALRDGFFDDNFSALLHLNGSSWKVVTYDIGATDVVWVDWDKTYGAPTVIFPRH